MKIRENLSLRRVMSMKIRENIRVRAVFAASAGRRGQLTDPRDSRGVGHALDDLAGFPHELQRHRRHALADAPAEARQHERRQRRRAQEEAWGSMRPCCLRTRQVAVCLRLATMRLGSPLLQLPS